MWIHSEKKFYCKKTYLKNFLQGEKSLGCFVDKANDKKIKFLAALSGGKWGRKFFYINVEENEFHHKIGPQSSKKNSIMIKVNFF